MVVEAFRRLRLPRRGRGVPDRHGARGRRRPAGQEPLRAERRHRRLLASLPAAPPQGRSSRRRACSPRPRSTARSAGGWGSPRRRSPRRIPGPSDAAIDAWLAARLAPARPHARPTSRGARCSRPASARWRSPTCVFPTPSGRIELASAEARTRWGVDELPGATASRRSTRSPAAAFPLRAPHPEHQEPHPQPVRQPRDDPPPGARAVRSGPPARTPPSAGSPRATARGSGTTAARSQLPVRLDWRPAARLRGGHQRLLADRGRCGQRAVRRAARPTSATARRSTTTPCSRTRMDRDPE